MTNNLKAERTLTAEDRVSDARLADIEEIVSLIVKGGDCRLYSADSKVSLPFKADTLLRLLSELQRLRSQSLSTQQPMGEVTDDLRYAFRNADNSDWEHLFAVLPDTGRGKFWKSVFKSAREALHPNQESGE